MNTKQLNASINRIPAKHRDPTPGWSEIIGSRVVTNKIADVYARSRMQFGSDTVLSQNPKCITTGKLGSFIVPTTRDSRPKNGSDWLQPGHDIEEATTDGVSKTKAKNHYNFKSDFKAMR